MTKEKIQKIVKQEVELYDFSDAFDYDRVALNISNRLEKLVIPKIASIESEIKSVRGEGNFYNCVDVDEVIEIVKKHLSNFSE